LPPAAPSIDRARQTDSTKRYLTPDLRRDLNELVDPRLTDVRLPSDRHRMKKKTERRKRTGKQVTRAVTVATGRVVAVAQIDPSYSPGGATVHGLLLRGIIIIIIYLLKSTEQEDAHMINTRTTAGQERHRKLTLTFCP